MDRAHMDTVIAALRSSDWHMQTLAVLADLALPQGAIGAGFVRNAVWDRLHGFEVMTHLADIDVLYFDPTNTTEDAENAVLGRLQAQLPDRPWSVKNQARMHIRNGDNPYHSTSDALRFWLETPTCVAARLVGRDQIELIAPYGLDDLINMDARPTERGLQKPDEFHKRMAVKNWVAFWPRVKIHAPRQGLPELR